MKKLFSLGLALVTASMFGACSSHTSDASDEREDGGYSSSPTNGGDQGVDTFCNVESDDDWVILEYQSDSIGYAWSKMTVKGDSIYYEERLNLAGEDPDTVSFADDADGMTVEDIVKASNLLCKDILEDGEESSSSTTSRSSSSSSLTSSSSSVYIDTSYYHYSSSVDLSTCEYSEEIFPDSTAEDPDSTIRTLVTTIPDSVVITKEAILYDASIYGKTTFLFRITQVYDKSVSQANIDAICDSIKNIVDYTTECNDDTVVTEYQNTNIADIIFDTYSDKWEESCEETNKNTRIQKACLFDIKDTVWEFYSRYSGYIYTIRQDTVEIKELSTYTYEDSETCQEYVGMYDYANGFCTDSTLTYTRDTDYYSIPERYTNRVGLYESAHTRCVSDNGY